MPRKSRKNKTYSAELKVQAVQDYLAGKGSQRQICKQYEQNMKQNEELRKEHKEEVSKMTEALNNNTLALQKLIDKLGDGK